MGDLTIDLRPDAGKHLYEQIYEYIRNEIRTGKLTKGEKLPSTRSLAQFHQISRSTVILAYDQLLSEGYIEAGPCRGYFVCAVEEDFASVSGHPAGDGARTERPDRMRPGGYGGRTDKTQRLYKDARLDKEEPKQEDFSVDFSPWAIDMTRFPYATWKRITRNILVDANSELFASGSSKGDLSLRNTLCSYLHASRGVNCGPEQIIIGAGNDYLLLLLEKILGRHVKLGMEDPTYERAWRMFDSFAYRIMPVTMDECGMRVDALKESGADVAYVMPSHQYPTGVVMPIGRRMELLRWADGGENRYLIEDDYDSEFRFRGKPVPSLQASDRNGRVIYMGTFSKSIAPAIRISYMVLPLPLLRVYESRCFFYSTTVSRIDQQILNAFIREGHFERHLNRMRKIYREKHDLLLEELKGMEERFDLSGADAGLHLLLHDRRGTGERELIAQAAQAGVKVYGMSGAFEGRPEAAQTGENTGKSDEKAGERNTVLLGYAALSCEQIRQGVSLLKSAWKQENSQCRSGLL